MSTHSTSSSGSSLGFISHRERTIIDWEESEDEYQVLPVPATTQVINKTNIWANNNIATNNQATVVRNQPLVEEAVGDCPSFDRRQPTPAVLLTKLPPSGTNRASAENSNHNNISIVLTTSANTRAPNNTNNNNANPPPVVASPIQATTATSTRPSNTTTGSNTYHHWDTRNIENWTFRNTNNDLLEPISNNNNRPEKSGFPSSEIGDGDSDSESGSNDPITQDDLSNNGYDGDDGEHAKLAFDSSDYRKHLKVMVPRSIPAQTTRANATVTTTARATNDTGHAGITGFGASMASFMPATTPAASKAARKAKTNTQPTSQEGGIIAIQEGSKNLGRKTHEWHPGKITKPLQVKVEGGKLRNVPYTVDATFQAIMKSPTFLGIVQRYKTYDTTSSDRKFQFAVLTHKETGTLSIEITSGKMKALVIDEGNRFFNNIAQEVCAELDKGIASSSSSTTTDRDPIFIGTEILRSYAQTTVDQYDTAHNTSYGPWATDSE